LIARLEGMWVAPEGAGTYAALVKLTTTRWIKPHEYVLLYNTGVGMKYAHLPPS